MTIIKKHFKSISRVIESLRMMRVDPAVMSLAYLGQSFRLVEQKEFNRMISDLKNTNKTLPEDIDFSPFGNELSEAPDDQAYDWHLDHRYPAEQAV